MKMAACVLMYWCECGNGRLCEGTVHSNDIQNRKNVFTLGVKLLDEFSFRSFRLFHSVELTMKIEKFDR